MTTAAIEVPCPKCNVAISFMCTRGSFCNERIRLAGMVTRDKNLKARAEAAKIK